MKVIYFTSFEFCRNNTKWVLLTSEVKEKSASVS